MTTKDELSTNDKIVLATLGVIVVWIGVTCAVGSFIIFGKFINLF